MKMYLSLALTIACISAHAEQQILNNKTDVLETKGYSYTPGELLIKVNSVIDLHQTKQPPVDLLAHDIATLGMPNANMSNEQMVDAASQSFHGGYQDPDNYMGLAAAKLIRGFVNVISFSSISNICSIWRPQTGGMIVEKMKAGELLSVEQMYSVTVKNGSRMIYATASGSSGSYALFCNTTNTQVPASSAFMLGFGNHFILVRGADTNVESISVSSKHFGLKSTNYVKALAPFQSCNPATDIHYTKFCDSYGLCAYDKITKCDGSDIGWVEITANGKDLAFDERAQDGSYKLVLNTGKDHFGYEEYLNIYACGDSRNDDLAKDTRFTAARDTSAVVSQLKRLENDKSNFKIQLFYNEFAQSGKCIGNIEVLK